MQLFGAWRFAPMLIFVAVVAIGLGHASELRAHAIEDATDFLLDAKMQIQQIDDLKKEVDELVPKVDAGEDESRLEGDEFQQPSGTLSSIMFLHQESTDAAHRFEQ